MSQWSRRKGETRPAVGSQELVLGYADVGALD